MTLSGLGQMIHKAPRQGRENAGLKNIRNRQKHSLQTSGSRPAATQPPGGRVAVSGDTTGCDSWPGGEVLPQPRPGISAVSAVLLDMMPSGGGQWSGRWQVVWEPRFTVTRGRAPAAHPAAPGTPMRVVLLSRVE